MYQLIFLALSWWQVDLGGRLSAYEFVFILLCCLHLSSPGILLWGHYVRLLAGLGLLWLSTQILFDRFLGSSVEDSLKGTANITAFLATFLILSLWLRRRGSNFALVTLGIGLVFVCQSIFQPNTLQEFDPWKFGLGYGVTLVATVICPRTKLSKSLLFVIFLSLGVTDMATGSRSLGAITIFSGLVQWVTRSGASDRAKKRRHVWKLAVAGGVSVVAIAAGYSWAVTQGLFGLDLQEKFAAQDASSLGVILSSRSESFGSIPAIVDAPILGHGSWARDGKYAALVQAAREDAGYLIPVDEDSDLIPTHSHLLGAWVQSGIFGALFWVVAFTLAWRSLLSLAVVESENLLTVAFCVSGMLWDILFSPLGNGTRLTSALSLAIAVRVLESFRKRKDSTEVDRLRSVQEV